MSELLVNINQRYKSSTRIDSGNVDIASFLDSFVLHGTAVNILETISKDYEGSDQRAYTLTGPYGSGKSTLGLFLSLLLDQNSRTRKLAQQKLESFNIEFANSFHHRFKIKKGWNVVKHVSSLTSPAHAFLESTYIAFDIEFDHSTIEAMSESACLTALQSTIESRQNQSDGTILLLDELGKALDFQSRSNSDLHLFQSLADITQKSKTPFIILGFLHQSFSEYAKNKDAVTQKEWAKVQGRYRDLGFNPSIDESLVLVGETIDCELTTRKALNDNCSISLNPVLQHFAIHARNEEILRKTMPLDPLVSLLLGPISRRRFSQNERSLFGFLASHEKHGFREFLIANYSVLQDKPALYGPETLWDYLHHNLHHVITTSQDSKAWLEGCDAIYRSEQKGEWLHVVAAKTIALMTIFGFQHNLHASRNFIIDYFVARGHSLQAIKEILSDLESWSIVIYRQQHDALFIFQGSDIDIHNMVLDKITAVSHGVDWTTVCQSHQVVMATAHYHRTGTMRWATTQLISKINTVFIENCKATPISGQSFVTFVIPATVSIEAELHQIATQSPHIAVGKPTSLETLRSTAIELIALNQILKEEAKIKYDLIAKKELEERINHAEHKIDEELLSIFAGAQWSYQNGPVPTGPLSTAASDIADRLFPRTPVVINELVNRSKPSGSANSAIKKLMNAMLENSDREDLGFYEETFPPEKGIYLSALKSKGWHQYKKEGYCFPKTWSKDAIAANGNMHQLYLEGVRTIQFADGMVTLDDIYNVWMASPFGLTKGLLPIYGLALLKSLEGQVAYYDMDSTKQFIFIPELDEELVNKIYKYPKEAGVRYFEISEIQTNLLTNISTAIAGKGAIHGESSILAIAKHIVKIVHTLPHWVKKTSGDNFVDQKQGLTKEARALRNKVVSANDPYKLILEDLPDIFDLDKNDTALGMKLSIKLRTALDDLQGQHRMLVAGYKSILLRSLGAEFDEDLERRCDRVAMAANRPHIKELALRLGKYLKSDHKDFEFVMNLAIGAAEKNWTDTSIRNGLDQMQNMCVQFRRIESFNRLDTSIKTRPIAMISTDKDGSHVEFEGFYDRASILKPEVAIAIDKVKESINVLDKENQVAALSEILTNLLTPLSQEAE